MTLREKLLKRKKNNRWTTNHHKGKVIVKVRSESGHRWIASFDEDTGEILEFPQLVSKEHDLPSLAWSIKALDEALKKNNFEGILTGDKVVDRVEQLESEVSKLKEQQ